MTGSAVDRYLQSLTEHDWDGFSACLAEDFVRVGPYGDTYATKADYVSFISGLMPRLPDYSMEISRVTYADGVAFAELTENVTIDGVVVRTRECITFDLGVDGRIKRVEVFIQTPTPPDSKL